MKIHILGICGTFMAGIAQLAQQLGHEVSGCDANVYPPMSTQLQQQNINLIEGFAVEQFEYHPDLVIIGNAMTRGNPAVEYVLNNNIPYTSGPAWLSEHVLQGRHVLAVAGTHGKTTTSSMLAWVLEHAGLAPGFMIGGIPENFSISARLGEQPYFVIEADEYDSAFFDKRSKFVHYHPRTLVLNNLEYDHADIFPNLAAIQTQFHHLVRIVPEQGAIIYPEHDQNLQDVLEQGCWTPTTLIGSLGWHAKACNPEQSIFDVYYGDVHKGTVNWSLISEYNVNNALAVFAAAAHIGITPKQTANALNDFKSVKRRMQQLTNHGGITLIDDFAHHPTAIKMTLDALRNKVGQRRIIALIELGSYTMRSGEHQTNLLPGINNADHVIFYKTDPNWQLQGNTTTDWQSKDNVDDILLTVGELMKEGDQIIIMSNGSFGGLKPRLQEVIEARS